MPTNRPQRILVCGGRDFSDRDFFDMVMGDCHRHFHSDFVIIQGGAKGADLMAKEWAIGLGVAVMEFPANWFIYRKGAGSIRNSWMLQFGIPDLVIGFPGGSGTKDMLKQSSARGINVYEPSRVHRYQPSDG